MQRKPDTPFLFSRRQTHMNHAQCSSDHAVTLKIFIALGISALIPLPQQLSHIEFPDTHTKRCIFACVYGVFGYNY